MTLGDLMVFGAGTVEPSRFADETFELFSIPAHDRDTPDVVTGADIGSAKQLVRPGDVLLSRIIPHIRRARVVRSASGRRLLASGEWIVFRSEHFDPDYLKHLLISDRFHSQFMTTVAGVGGSLLRARPAFVARLQVLLPPLDEQRRIAEVLDRADALRAKRGAALAQLATLTPFIFLDMFGDPMDRSTPWPTTILSEAVLEGTIVTYGIVQAGEEVPGGVPYIRTGDIVDGELAVHQLRRTAPEIAARFSRSRVQTGDIVMSIRATVGTTAVVPPELDGSNLTQGTARIAPSEAVQGPYLLNMLRTPSVQHWIQRQVKGATFREITLSRLRELPVTVPPRTLQQAFARRSAQVDTLKMNQRAWLGRFDTLFASLQHRAFAAEL